MSYDDDTDPVTGFLRLSVEAAAQNEKNAERQREYAEAEWRRAWWLTTMALAEVPDTPRTGLTVAYDNAEHILGQNRSYLADRRGTGRALKDLRLKAKIFSLPPRLTMEYVRAGGDPVNAAGYLTDAEQRGISLRDLAAELGTQPASWQREGERRENPLAGMSDAEKAEAARTALTDPAVADLAFNRPDHAEHRSQTQQILANVAGARNQAERERLQRRQDTQSETSRHVNKGLAEAGAKLTLDDALLRYKRACAEFREAVAEALPQAGSYGGGDHPMSLAGLLAEARGQHALAGTALDALGSYVSGAASMDAELAKIMDGDR